jgi:hypothetical protein
MSLVLMIPVLSVGCAVDALNWGLTGFGMLSDQYRPDYGSKPDPAPCGEAYMAKRADRAVSRTSEATSWTAAEFGHSLERARSN